MPRARRGFTLVELLIVISVIIILATMMLGIRASNPEGLGNGQRMMADMLRIARVQAQMNRAAMPAPAGTLWGSNTTNYKWSPGYYRYRLLIKCDPLDPDTHLREMVIAIGMTGVGASPTKYTWFSPEPPVRLPPGVFFVPPNYNSANGMTGSPSLATTPVVMPTGTSLSGTSAATRISRIPGLADLASSATTSLANGTNEYCTPSTTSQAPMMLYRPIFSPTAQGTVITYFDAWTLANGGKYWYYVELGPDGTNNHLGKVVLVLAEGVNVGGGNVRLSSPDKFAAILVRRNGDVSLTTDTDDLESTGTSTLLK